jgi:hypothetical protein
MKRLGIFVTAVIAGFAVVGCGNNAAPTVATEASMAADAAEVAAVPQLSSSESSSRSGLTRAQQNAVRSAESYLAMSGFSRDGLINQLSSDAGDGYGAEDAKIAVDSLTVDWNEQAQRSAEQYLAMQGFSCNGLVEQLSSDAGDKYTKAQAGHGARAAGACD